MKKRIISILLVISIFCFSLGIGKRASAAATGTIVAIASIGTLAFSVFTLITSGQAEQIADDVYNWIEYTAKPGMEVAFTGDGSWLATGYNQIFQTVKGWFDNGELEIVDGQVKLTYQQYLELYGQVINVTSKPDVSFQSGYNCSFLDVDLSRSFALSNLPHLSEYFETSNGQSYAAVYYDENTLVFSTYYLFFNFYDHVLRFSSRYLKGLENSNWSSIDGGLNAGFPSDRYPTFNDFYNSYPYIFSMSSLSNFSETCNSSVWNRNFSECYVFSNGQLSLQPISEVDVSEMESGLITTTGNYGSFLKTLTDYSATMVPAADGLDDLVGTIPTEYNPSLSFPVEPDLTTPIPNQVIVSNVPGVADLPLSDYQAQIKTDIDVPSVITSKFPFCIPFDFIRFLGILLAEPVAPVFHIPISTHPDNLEQWEGNETVDEYLNPDNPMFEIDEEIVIDLSVIPLVQPICYTCFIVGFIFLLLHITPKMIQH